MPRYRTKAWVEQYVEIEVEAESERDAYEKMREEGREYRVTFSWSNMDCEIPYHLGSIVEVEE